MRLLRCIDVRLQPSYVCVLPQKRGPTPLFLAANGGYVEAANKLIAVGAKLESRDLVCPLRPSFHFFLAFP